MLAPERWAHEPRAGGGGAPGHGKAVQVDLIKPKLKPPRRKRLKLRCDVPLSNLALKSHMHRYIMAGGENVFFHGAAGTVGRCKLTLVNPR